MIRDILMARLDARKSHAEPYGKRAPNMAYQQPQQPGRIICESLSSLKEEIEKMQPPNKAELTEAVHKLWLFRGCDRMSSK
ncbi:MAG: hypothetical protein KME20_06645 [Kaiparowitsia implicata GSE-PSE-MK54-09C]|jgi:hypothetical protein|nr:hypothetical protein [Kaiparowitsia implicata GSE-PSE-MK54-09C]